MKQSIITRFAPSPTGDLHIGSARTALFNWLHARHHGGKFLLRIEDTDTGRHSEQSMQSIFAGLEWLGLNYDDEFVLQSHNKSLHRALALHLVESGKAFFCYDQVKDSQFGSTAYRSPWRDKESAAPQEEGKEARPAIRFKAPSTEQITFYDQVIGDLSISPSQVEDFVILRSDGNPTYPLAVVHDDHQMQVTDVIRGTDHITNTFKQALIYEALGWSVPRFAHIPLIHDEEGHKLSKRLGALSVFEYKNQGYLPQAVINYLLRLGWSHGNEEVIDINQAIEWFEITDVNSAPPRIDREKLLHLNHLYMQKEEHIQALALPFFEQELGRSLNPEEHKILTKAIQPIVKRHKTLAEAASSTKFLFDVDAPLLSPAQLDSLQTAILRSVMEKLDNIPDQEISNEEITKLIGEVALEQGIKKKEVFKTLRITIADNSESLPINAIMEALGRKPIITRIAETLKRLASSQ